MSKDWRSILPERRVYHSWIFMMIAMAGMAFHFDNTFVTTNALLAIWMKMK